MKKRLFPFLTACLLSVGVSQAEVAQLSGASKVKLEDTPAAVQNAIKTQAGSAQIEDIDRGTLNGRVVYEAAFKKEGQHTELRVAEDGTVVDTIVAGKSAGTASSDVAATPTSPEATTTEAAGAPSAAVESDGALAFDAGFDRTLSGARKVTWQEVPPTVQRIIKEKAGSAKIEDIDYGKGGKRMIYQAAYKKNGKHTELRVTEDGRFYREVAEGKIVSASPGAGAVGSRVAATASGSAGFSTPLTNGRNVSWQQVPEKVRQIVQERLGSSQAETVRRGSINGKTVYQFTYERNGERGQLRVSEDGSFVKDILAGRVVSEPAGSDLD